LAVAWATSTSGSVSSPAGAFAVLLRRSEPRRHSGPRRSQSRSLLTQMAARAPRQEHNATPVALGAGPTGRRRPLLTAHWREVGAAAEMLVADREQVARDRWLPSQPSSRTLSLHAYTSHANAAAPSAQTRQHRCGRESPPRERATVSRDCSVFVRCTTVRGALRPLLPVRAIVSAGLLPPTVVVGVTLTVEGE
jgi:hypothetical protein